MIDVSSLTPLQAAITLLIERRGKNGRRVRELTQELKQGKRAIVLALAHLTNSGVIVRIEGDIPKYYSPLAHVDSPLAHVDSPLAHVDSPLAHADSPLAHVDSPLAHVDSPLAHVDSPLAHAESPVFPKTPQKLPPKKERFMIQRKKQTKKEKLKFWKRILCLRNFLLLKRESIL